MTNRDIRHAFLLSHVAASLDALKREELATRKRKTAYYTRLEALEDGVNKALEKLPATLQPTHKVSERADRFFERVQELLNEALAP